MPTVVRLGWKLVPALTNAAMKKSDKRERHNANKFDVVNSPCLVSDFFIVSNTYSDRQADGNGVKLRDH